MRLEDIEAMAARMQAAGLSELEYAEGGARIVLRGPTGAAAPVNAAPHQTATAPMFGLFLPIHPQRLSAEVALGDLVQPGTILGYIDAGGVLYPVSADLAGTVARIVPQAGALVGYGAVIMEFA